MTINREMLVKLLVEKTDMKKADVEAQLDELTKRILDAAHRGKALEIKGFGLFYFDEDGELSFKPSEQLDSEINMEYAGMEPIELKPSKRKIPPSPPSVKEENEQQPDSDPDSKDKSEPQSEGDIYGIGKTLAGETEDDVGSEGEESAADPFSKLFQDPSPEVTPQKKEEIQRAGTTAGKKAPKSKRSKTPAKKKVRDPMSTIIFVILGIVVITVGYLIVSDYLVAPEPEEPTAQESEALVPIEAPPVSAEPDITENEEPVAADMVEENGDLSDAEEETEPEQDIASEQDRYGLFGDYEEASGSEYTIVVHSLRDQGVAERTANELAHEGYRTIVTERTVDERIVFRVGIGQFETIQSAVSEAESLPEPYRNQNFIQRIQ